VTRAIAHTLRTAIASGLFFALAPNANALPILSVDTDPLLAGIQAERTVILGDLFDVDLVITDVEASDPLHAYELDLGFDPSVIGALTLSPGPFLGAPTFELQSEIEAGAVQYAVTRIGPAGATGAGVLISLRFEARALGTSVLDLSNVLLSAPGGVPILGFEQFDGAITVGPIPEASSVLLLVVGGALVVGAVWRQGALR
jgi:hypothetical protein